MRILALASQKGGSGKTTLSGHLAVQAQRAGAGPVVLIDIDPQGSLADWWNEREAEFPAFAQTTVARLTVDLCERAGKPLIFVVNAATPKARITSEAAVALSQHGTVAPVTLHHRTDFAASMIDGRTVMEVDPRGRSAGEVESLWAYVSDRLEKNFRRTVFSVPHGSVGTVAARPVGGGFGRRVSQ